MFAEMLLTKIVTLCCLVLCISAYCERMSQQEKLYEPCVWDGSEFLCLCSKASEQTWTNCTGRGLKYIPKIPETTAFLFLGNNDLTSLTSDMLVNISNKHLEYLEISSNNLSFIEEGVFHVFEGLLTLDLSHNPLTSDVLIKSFSDIPKSIHELCLNNVSLPPVFSENLFLPFKDSKLKFIQLNFNHMRSFNSNRLFEYLPRLLGLDLSMNYLKFANFSVSKTLAYLYLSYNDLTNFPEFCMNDTTPFFPSLRSLFLDQNCLSTLQMKKVNCLANLKMFNVSETRINTLHPNIFNELKSIDTIALDNIVSLVSIQPFAFRSKTLKKIRLRGTSLQFKTKDVNIKHVFGGCPQLTHLDISGNFVGRLNTSDWAIMFSDIPNLLYLNVSNSGLLYIPKSWPKVIPHLIGLDVGNNDIPHIPRYYFEPFKNITYLSMNRNQFTSFQEYDLPKNLKFLNLIQNPYICDCVLLWFIDFVKKNHSILKYYPKEYTCRGTNHTIISFKIRKEACSISREISIVIETTCFLSILVCLVCAGIYRFRWRLRYVLYLFTYHKRQINAVIESDYQHDIFVSCAREEYDVVLESIVKRLEEQESFRVFITERNVQANESKMGATLANLDKSQFFMICLSNKFCEDQWCEFETNMAMQKSLYEHAGNVIVVLLEDISIENMNKQLWWLVRNDEYLLWDENEDTCELFWMKLRTRLNSSQGNGQNIPMSNLSQ